MRLLLDESIPSRLRRSLTDHSVRTVVEAGWLRILNRRLYRQEGCVVRTIQRTVVLLMATFASITWAQEPPLLASNRW